MNHLSALRMIFGAIGLLPFLLATPATAAPESRLGRLFFTPQERAALDRQRQTGVADAGDTLAINGIARNQASGRSTVWINGRPWHEAAKLTGVRPAPRQPAHVAVDAGQGHALTVQVGESANRVTGEIRGTLAGGQVIVHAPSRAKP